MNKRKRDLTPEEFENIYSKVPRVTTEIIAIHNNKVALIKRHEDSWHGQVHVPGGTVLYQETLVDAVKRNAKEELDIDVEVGEQVGYIEYPSEVKERGYGWSIGIAFVCKIISDIDYDLWNKEGIKLYEEIPDNLIIEQREILQSVLESIKHQA